MPETTLSQITPRVYWMSPGKPDRPALAAVVGTEFTLMLDAGASADHAQLFLNSLSERQIAAPRLVALTHWHWDHVFGAAEIGVPVIAHRQTAKKIAEMAQEEWTDAAIDARIAHDELLGLLADDIKEELPEPRRIKIVLPQLIYDDTLEIRAGDVTITLKHIGGDHAADSCMMYIMPDKVLFLGDCLYHAFIPENHFTSQLLRLLDIISGMEVAYFIQGHDETVMSRVAFEKMTAQMRLAHKLAAEIGLDEAAVTAAAQAHTGEPVDEDMTYFIRTFIAGANLR